MCTKNFQKIFSGVLSGKKSTLILVKLVVIFELFLTLKGKTKLIPIVPKSVILSEITINNISDVNFFHFVEICRRLPRTDVVFAFRGYGNKSFLKDNLVNF
jgi:hypothetical protein